MPSTSPSWAVVWVRGHDGSLGFGWVVVGVSLASLTELDRFKETPFDRGYPESPRMFYSPGDQIHEVLKVMLQSATHSVVIGMYEYDDPDLDTIVRAKLESRTIVVQINLDLRQSRGTNESAILQKWDNTGVGNSIAVGHSEKDAPMHLKMVIIDGVDVITGSTNWSHSGEADQDNELTVIRDPHVAAEARTRLDIIHDTMLKHMAKKATQP